MNFLEHDFVPYRAETSIGGGRVLVLAPHPDDEVIGCGGAIMRHAEAGDPTRVVIVTDGALGGIAETTDHAQARQRESIRAAAILGYGEPLFWGLPDRGLEYGEALIGRILDALEDWTADLVYAPSWWEIHPDHLILALATSEAARRCPRPIRLAMYEVGVPLHPTTLLDITPLQARKQAAMACFASQLKQQGYDRHVAALNCFRTYTLPPSVLAAEAYRLVERDALRQDPLRAIRPGDYYTQTASRTTAAPPLVSIVLLDGEAERLADTLDSIALQTYGNIEILIIDGRGGETAFEPFARPARFPARTIPSTTPLLSAEAANLGLDQARGDYLLLLDGGDILFPDHVAALVETLARSTPARCAYSGVRIETGMTGEPAPTYSLNRPVPRLELWGGTSIPLAAVLFARSLCDEGCRFDARLDRFDHWDFLVQLSLRTDFVHLNRVSAARRRAAPLESDGSGESNRTDTREARFEKWKSIWSGRQLADMFRHRDEMRLESERSLATSNTRLSACEATLEQREREHAGLGLQLAERETALLDLRRAGIALQDQMIERDTEVDRLKAQVNALQDDIQALRRSTSWRITAPLRWLVSNARQARATWFKFKNSF